MNYQNIRYFRKVMVKNYIAPFLLCLACLILIGHNMVPHHHHHHNDSPVPHHEAHHHHHGNADTGTLNNLFSFLYHADNEVAFTITHPVVNTFTKHLLHLVAVLPDDFFIDDFDIPPLLLMQTRENHHYFFSPPRLYGLRAPPAVII